MPGLRTFTRIFRAFRSLVQVRAKERTAALLALYAVTSYSATKDAIEAMLSLRESQLLAYCRERGIRYLVLPHPAYVPATAATIGIDPELYLRTRLARRTVWSRLYLGEHIAGFVPLSDGALSIWKIE